MQNQSRYKKIPLLLSRFEGGMTVKVGRSDTSWMVRVLDHFADHHLPIHLILNADMRTTLLKDP